MALWWPEEEELTRLTREKCVELLKIKFYDVSMGENVVGKYFCEEVLPFLKDFFCNKVILGAKEKKKTLAENMLKVVSEAQKKPLLKLEWGEVFLSIYRYRSRYLTPTEFTHLISLFRSKTENCRALERAVSYLFKNQTDPCNALIGVGSSSTLPSKCTPLSKLLNSKDRQSELDHIQSLVFDIHKLADTSSSSSSPHASRLYAQANQLLQTLQSPPEGHSEACPPYSVVLVRQDTVEESYIFARCVAFMGTDFAKVYLGVTHNSLRVVLSSQVLVIPEEILNSAMFLDFDKKLSTSSSSLLMGVSSCPPEDLEGQEKNQAKISELVEDPLEELYRDFDLLTEAHLHAVLRTHGVNLNALMQAKEVHDQYQQRAEEDDTLPKLYLHLGPVVGECGTAVKKVIRLVRGEIKKNEEKKAGGGGGGDSSSPRPSSKPERMKSQSMQRCSLVGELSCSGQSGSIESSGSMDDLSCLSAAAAEEIKTVASKCRSYVARWLRSEMGCHPVIVDDHLAKRVMELAESPLQRILDTLERIKGMLRYVEKKIEERLTVVVNGELKDEMTDWWTEYIDMRVDQYLVSFGYDPDALPEGFFMSTQGPVPEVRRNLEIIESLIDIDSPHVEETRDFIVEVTDEVCIRVAELEEEIVNVVALATGLPIDTIDGERLDWILGELKAGNMKAQHYIPNEGLEFIILDLKHIHKMQRMYEEWRAHSDIFASDEKNDLEVVPIHGCVFGGFKTREKNLVNYLEEMEERGG